MKLQKAQARHEAAKIKIFKSCSHEQCSPKSALLLVEEKKASMSLKITGHTMGKPEAAKIKKYVETKSVTSYFGLFNLATLEDFYSKGSCMQHIYIFCVNTIHSVF